MKKPAMGRLKKMSQEPWEISSDCCRDVSSICARTVASTSGAIGKCSFRIP